MKMPIHKACFLIFLTLSTIQSCTDDFKIINSNPNAPIQVEPAFLLRQVIYNYGEQMSYEGFVAGNLLGQYFTAVDFNLFDRHSLSEPQFGGNPWPIIYQDLRDNEIILQRSRSNPAYAVYEGPALIMKAYMSAALTDIFGDVPYTEALQGKSGIINPGYDPQQEIYTTSGGILDNLKTGIARINNYQSAIPLTGDILYNGNLSNWIRFANSLRIKCLVRISGKVDVKTELNEIYQSGLYITGSSQDAIFNFTAGAPNNFRMAIAKVGDFNLYVMSLTMDEILKAYKDPRSMTYFRPAAKSNTYAGLLNGPDASKTSISVGDYSLSGTIFRENSGVLKANFITSWETNLLLAEAAFKGLIPADPKALYDAGVTACFNYWKTALPPGYLKDSPTAYGVGAEPLEQIITQKWLGQIINGYEGWIDFRRTGFPKFKNVAASLNQNKIPVRMPYPIDEEALNSENFKKAQTATNGNSINEPVWWNK